MSSYHWKICLICSVKETPRAGRAINKQLHYTRGIVMRISTLIERIYLKKTEKIQEQIFKAGIYDLDALIEYQRRIRKYFLLPPIWEESEPVARDRKSLEIDFEGLKLADKEDLTEKEQFRLKRAQAQYNNFYKNRVERIKNIQVQNTPYNGKEEDINNMLNYVNKTIGEEPMTEFEKKSGKKVLERIKQLV